jgi:hypothetical protein
MALAHHHGARWHSAWPSAGAQIDKQTSISRETSRHVAKFSPPRTHVNDSFTRFVKSEHVEGLHVHVKADLDPRSPAGLLHRQGQHGSTNRLDSTLTSLIEKVRATVVAT